MSYILNKTNGSIIATVQDATLDLTTDLALPGRNYAGYGESQNESFIKLLENFANTTAPSKPIEGELWYDTAKKHINVYDSTDWKSIANLEVSTTNPLNVNNPPPAGNLWYNPLEEQLYASNGEAFVLIGPPTGADIKAGWRGSYEQDANQQPGVNIYNIKAVIGPDVVAIVSNQEYTVSAISTNTYPIYEEPNIPRLHKGINLRGANASTGISAYADASNVYTSGTIVWGTAAHSIISNFSDKSGSFSYTESSANVYKPVAFLTTASGGLASTNIDYGFTYNPSTHYVKATRFEGVATSALYADIAERYAADEIYEPGTVLVIGGEKEVTAVATKGVTAWAGVVSTNPAYMMNSEAGTDKTHPYIALKGRVPCKVVGPICRGDLLVTSVIRGHAEVYNPKKQEPHAVFARALEDFNGDVGVIEVKI